MKKYIFAFLLALLVVLTGMTLRRSMAAVGGSPIPWPPARVAAIGGAPIPWPPARVAAIGGAPIPWPPAKPASASSR